MEIIDLAPGVVGLAILTVMALAPLAVDLPLAARRTAVPAAAPPSRLRCGDQDGGLATRPAVAGAACRHAVGPAF